MYKVFNISEIEVLESNRWSGTADSVRRSNDGESFITQLKSGVSALPTDDPLISKEEAKALMSTPNWFREEDF